MRKILFALSLTLLVCNIMAQSVKSISDAIEIVNEKKVIHVEKLNFPGNMTAYAALGMLPEIFSRPSGTGESLTNYEIKIDGVSVEGFRDAALNIRICDILKIEVKESPTDSYNKKAESGSIDIKLKNATEKPSGNISLHTNYPAQIAPTGIFLIQKKKLEIKVLSSVEYASPHETEVETETYSNETGALYSTTSKFSNKNSWREIVRTYLNYSPTDNNLLKFTISELYSHSLNKGSQTIGEGGRNNFSSAYENNFRILANTEYKHTFKDSSVFDFELNYNFSPLRRGFDDASRSVSYSNDKHSLAGKAEYEARLLAPENKNMLKLILGSNYNFQFSNDISKSNDKFEPLEFNIDGKYMNLSPYLQCEGKFGTFSFKVIGEYQLYNFYTKGKDIAGTVKDVATTSNWKNNYTYKLMTAWRFHPQHRLRLIVDRKLNTPSQKQLFPYLVYSSTNKSFVLGNPDLEPSATNEIKLEYISGLDWGNSSMMIDASVSYLQTDNIIKSKENQEQAEYQYTYLTFTNGGTNKALATNLMVNFRTGKFTTSLVGNIYFNNEEYKEGKKNHYNYANTSLVSIYNFNKGWDISGALNYYGNIDTETGKLGDCLIASICGGKTWKKWALQGYIYLPLTGKTRNTIQGEINTQYIKYYLEEPMAGITLRYQF